MLFRSANDFDKGETARLPRWSLIIIFSVHFSMSSLREPEPGIMRHREQPPPIPFGNQRHPLHRSHVFHRLSIYKIYIIIRNSARTERAKRKYEVPRCLVSSNIFLKPDWREGGCTYQRTYSTVPQCFDLRIYVCTFTRKTSVA